jgi:hypothetical protein
MSASSRGLIASSRHISDWLARAAARMNDLQWWWTACLTKITLKATIDYDGGLGERISCN